MKTLIFDTNAGLLQWVTETEDFKAALAEFDKDVGIDPHDRGLNTDDWVFYRVTDEKAAEVIAWADRGAKGEFPL